MSDTITSPSGRTFSCIGVATTTHFSNRLPKKIYSLGPKGTIYWGGAGLDGAYIADQIQALKNVGIQDVSEGDGDKGHEIIDAIRTGTSLRYQDSGGSWPVAYKFSSSSKQFNLIGYSYGSLIAARTADFYTIRGYVIDHLVLIASPIDQGFYNSLAMNKRIKNIIHINLTDVEDPIFVGISEPDLVSSIAILEEQDKASGTTEGFGHFYFRPDSDEGRRRRANLAKYLYEQGLR